MKKFIVCILICFFINCTCFAREEKLIIFDSSVSMLDVFSGKPKYIIAAEETKKVLDNMPDSDYIGLRTIGVSIDAGLIYLIQNPGELCKSTQLAVPISSYNRDTIKSNLDSLFPLGTTPLTYTLDLAINYDFSDYASLKHIILITDGAESCNGDPCKYIREIMRTRNDIKIDIIAIGVNAEDFKQLKCLTDNTNGAVFNAMNPNEIGQALNNIFTPDYNNNVNSIRQNNYNKENIIYKNYMFETLD
ncbi:MAG: VWA domain-containing protein [Candidatus Gastranaerophilales bacterium]|nr:VWA domain-containing protein [Candidatus Gastranaerophilales bacterium]